MRAVLVVGLFGLLGACTVANPLYVGRDAGGVVITDGSVVVGSPDMSGVDLAKPPDPGCTTGERSCSASDSLVCQSGSFVSDRTCPKASAIAAASVCADGYCAPPAGAVSCEAEGGQTEAACFGIGGMGTLSCQPFASTGSVKWFCATTVGMGGSGSPCNVGSVCRSGFCGSNGTCFRACISDNDCPQMGNANTCTDVGISLEGQTITAGSCIHGN